MLAEPESEELLTVKQAATVLHLHERTIRNYINDARLPARKMLGGKGWFIRRTDLFTVLQTSSNLHRPVARSGAVRAGSDPIHVEPDVGIIRRTHTPEGRARAVDVLRRLRAGDAQEQTQAWNLLKTALDEDRPSYRKLFSEHGPSAPETHPQGKPT